MYSDAAGVELAIESFPIVLAVNFYLVTHLIKAAAESGADSFFECMSCAFNFAPVAQLGRAAFNVFLVRGLGGNLVQKVRGENCELTIVVTLVNDLIHRIANPIGGNCSPELVEH